MFKLIKNELYKLFNKKSTYIVLVVGLLFIVLVNYLYNLSLDNLFPEDYDYYITENEKALKELNSYDEMEKNNLESEIEGYKLLKDYHETWQEEAIYAYFIPAYNNYLNELETSDTYEDIKNKIIKGNWQYFINLKIKEEEENLKIVKNEKEKEKCEIKIELYNYVLNNNIKNDGSYLAVAYENMLGNLDALMDYKYTDNEKEKDALKDKVADYYENRYILYNKVDNNNMHSLRYVLINYYNEIEIIIFIFTIMIAGAMVSDEFNKGTIKNLLTVPYKRWQILLAKFISCLVMVIFISIFLVIGELLIGGLFYGYSSLKLPVIKYLVSDNKYLEINIFKYLCLIFVSKIPVIILLMSLAFTVSVVFLNTALAIIIPFLGYMASSFINYFQEIYNLKILNYFVTPNWDFSYYLFKGSNPFGLSLTHAIIVCLVYEAILLIVAFIVFQKRNVKNV